MRGVVPLPCPPISQFWAARGLLSCHQIRPKTQILSTERQEEATECTEHTHARCHASPWTYFCVHLPITASADYLLAHLLTYLPTSPPRYLQTYHPSLLISSRRSSNTISLVQPLTGSRACTSPALHSPAGAISSSLPFPSVAITYVPSMSHLILRRDVERLQPAKPSRPFSSRLQSSRDHFHR